MNFMSFRNLLALVGLLTVGAVLTGCSNSNSDGDTGKATTPPAGGKVKSDTATTASPSGGSDGGVSKPQAMPKDGN